LASGPLIVGSLLKNEKNGFFNMSMVLGSGALIATGIALGNYIYDRTKNKSVL